MVVRLNPWAAKRRSAASRMSWRVSLGMPLINRLVKAVSTAVGRPPADLVRARTELAPGPPALPQQHLTVAPHEVVRQLAHLGVAEPAVEPPRSGIEGRDAEEDVGTVPEDPALGVRHQPGAEAAPPLLGRYRDRLDVPDE